MQLINAPGKLVLPFANAGAKNTIPVASQIGIVAGAASLTDGFPPLTRTPLAAGGVPPSGLDMNGVLYELSAIVRWANAGGGYVFDATFATDPDVAGYPKGARVLRSDGLGYWFNTVDGNETDPEANAVAAIAAGWVPDFTNGAAAVTMTNANVTLTPLQYGKPVIIISGTLTANLNLILPTGMVGEWAIINNTTGAYTITAKTAAGTGVVVPSAAFVVGDGTNIYNTAGAITPPVVGTARNVLMSVTAASATATLTADEIVVETALCGTAYKLSSFSKTVNLATTGAGGMDTGTAPTSGYVALYAIYNPNTGTSALLAVNATAAARPSVYGGANMPAGYTASALVSVWPTNASGQFKVAVQRDRAVRFGIITILSGVTAASLSSATLAAAVPKNAVSWSGIISCTVGATGSLAYAGNLAADASGTGQVQIQQVGTSGTSGTVNSSVPFADIPIIAAQTAYYSTQNTTGMSAFATGYKF